MTELLQVEVAPVTSARGQDFRNGVGNSLPAIAMAVIVLALWEGLVRLFNIQQFLLPPPSAILNAFIEHGSELLVSTRLAVVEAFGGLMLGMVLAVIAALAASRWNIIGRALIPFAIGLNAVPTLVFAPIMNNWFGSINSMSKMMIVVTLVYYPIMINVVKGLTQVNPAALDLMQSYGSSEAAIFIKLRIPNMLPYFFSAMKLGATLSVIGTVVAGYFGGQRAALGVWILNEVILFRFPNAWAGILVACLIGLSFYMVISVLERMFIPWHSSMRGEPSH